jgi:hypothetical protein
MLRLTTHPAFPTRRQQAFTDAHAPARIEPGAIPGTAVVYLHDERLIERIIIDEQAQMLHSISYQPTPGDLIFV